MKKAIIVLILMLSTLFVFGCTKEPPIIKYETQNCSYDNYITKEDANKCVQVANILINITNKCFALTNQTPLPPMGPYT